MSTEGRKRRRWPKHITSAQFAFAEDFTERFKTAIEIVALTESDDDFDDHLRVWSVHLGVLAYDVYRSVVKLLKSGDVRTAYMLSRCLLDYHIRLRYYVVQSQEPKREWIASSGKNTKNYLQRMKAYQDWNNTKDKTFSILAKRSQQEWGDIPMDERERIEADLARDKIVFSRSIDYMLREAQPERWGDYYSHHQLQSAFLHGDQVATHNTMDVGGGLLKCAYFDDEKLSPRITLGDSYLWCYEMLKSIELFRGWSYDKDASFERAFFAFFDATD